jgi:hypothetical protein
MPPDLALDMPMCQLWVLTAASEAMEGKMPSGADYYEISRSLPAAWVHPVGTECEGDQIEQAVNDDKSKHEVHDGNVA